MRLTVRDVPNAGNAKDGIIAGLIWKSMDGMATDVRLEKKEKNGTKMNRERPAE